MRTHRRYTHASASDDRTRNVVVVVSAVVASGIAEKCNLWQCCFWAAPTFMLQITNPLIFYQYNDFVVVAEDKIKFVIFEITNNTRRKQVENMKTQSFNISNRRVDYRLLV